MLTTRIGRLLTRAFTRDTRPVVRAPAARPRFRPGLDPLEGRDTPATFHWLGGLASNWAGYAGNWTTVASPAGPRSTVLPGLPDALRFDGAVSNQSAFSLGYNTSGYQSVSFVGGYTGTAQTGTTLTYTSFTLDAPGKYDAIAAQTVTGAFTWKKGDLGGNGNVMNINGTTATITPGTGVAATVSSGMGLSFGGSVAATITGGTLNFITARSIVVTDNSNVSATNVAFTAPADSEAITLPAGKSQTFKANHADAAMGLKVDGGTAHIEGGGAVKFKGVVPNTTDTVRLHGGALVIENGTTLEVGAGQSVGIAGGKLATKPQDVMVQQPAKIKAAFVGVAGGEIILGDGSYTPDIQGHKFSVLRIEGTVAWSGGTFKPSVDPAQGKTTCDRWESSDNFFVGGTAKVEPGPDTATVGNEYTVLKTDAGKSFQKLKADSPKPSLDETKWYWKTGTGFLTNTWVLKRGQLD